MNNKLDYVEQQFGELNDELRVFTDQCAQLLNERQLVRNELSRGEDSSLTLFKKAFDSFLAVPLLYRKNLRVDSAIILRHLLNVFIWFARVNTPEEGKPVDYWASRYIEWGWVAELDELQRIKNGKSERSESLLSRESEISTNYSRVKQLYVNEKGRRSRYWYGDSIKECAKDLSLSPTYENGYSILSGFEHADYFSLSRWNEPNRFRLFSIEILKLNCSYFRVIVKHIAESFQLLDTQSLEDMFQKVKELDSLFSELKEDLRV